MKYRRDYQETHDIDWFFRYKGKVYHAASNGGLLPDKVDSRSNRFLQKRLEDITGECKVELSEWINKQDEDWSSFQEYAAKGFVSLDRNEKNGCHEGKQHYHIVAFPLNDATSINEDLLQLMPELLDNEIEIDVEE